MNKFGGKLGQLRLEEDINYVYYKVYLPKINNEKINVEVLDGIVNVSAESERVEEKKIEGTFSKSAFKQRIERLFPVPRNTNGAKVTFKLDGDYLVIQFLKMGKGLKGSYTQLLNHEHFT